MSYTLRGVRGSAAVKRSSGKPIFWRRFAAWAQIPKQAGPTFHIFAADKC